jgi:type VI secretion system protein ImpA
VPTASVIDVAALLQAIPGDKPTGMDLRANTEPGSLYYAIKDARNAARAAERRLESGSEDTTAPDWKTPFQLAGKALQSSTKDLELSAYLIEAAVRLHGFAGLRDGFRVATGLLQNFWGQLYPVADEDGPSTIVAPLAGLNGSDAEGTLLAPIRNVPFAVSDAHGKLSYSSYLQALSTGKIADEKSRDKKIADGAMTFDAIRQAINETPKADIVRLHDDLAEAQAAFDDYTRVVEVKATNNAPPTTAIRAALVQVMDAVKDLARDILATTLRAPEPEAEEEDNGTAKAAKTDTRGGGEQLPTIRTRDDAFAAILQLADYFRRIEPHSLVPHALEQSVRWGRMPLPDLLSELIPDDDSRGALFKQVGIRNGELQATTEEKKRR